MADMETQEKESAVLLLAQCKKLKESDDVWESILPSAVRMNDEKVGDLSRRLDVLAENAGIYLIDGTFSYAVGKFTLKPGMPPVCISKTPADEQQAIQEWLLIKNKK
jgi:hypothetical protein